jgi:transcriptional regulator with XRE-family HTH domain
MAAVPSPTFGALLKRYRLAAGLTQEELAAEEGLSLRGIADLERGARTQPCKEAVQLLVEALHLSAPERAQLEAAVAILGKLGERFYVQRIERLLCSAEFH